MTIQEKSVVQNDYGEETITWVEVGTYWAAVEPLRGREFVEFLREGAELTTRIVLRYQGDTGLLQEHRVTWGDHVYDVVQVIEVDTRHREYQLLCREVVAVGAAASGFDGA